MPREKLPFGPPPPGKDLAMMYSGRLGHILFSFSVVCMVLCCMGVASFVMSAVLILVALVGVLITLGTVFSFAPDFFTDMLDAAGNAIEFSQMLLDIFPILFACGTACAALAVVFYALDRSRRHIGGIVLSSIFLGILLILLIVYLI